MAVANAGWLMLGRVLGDGLSLVLFTIIAREYGPSGVGIYSTYFAIATLLYDVVALGIDDFGVREYAASPAQQREALLRRLLKLQLLVAAVAVGGVAVAVAIRGINLVQAATLLFLATFQVCNAFARLLIIPSLVDGSVAAITLGGVVTRAGVAVVALLASLSHEPSLLVALSGFPVFGLLNLAFAAWLHRRIMAREPAAPEPIQWGLLRRLLPFAAANALSSIVVRIPLVVLFAMSGEVAAGLYATAFKLAELGWQALLYVPLASYAALTRAAHSHPEALAVEAEHLLRQTLVLGGVIAWGLYALGPPLLVPLLGAKVAAASPLLEAMALFLLVQSMGTFLLRLILVMGLQELRLKILTTQAIVTALLCALLAEHSGPLGTVYALAAGETLTAVLHYLALRRHMGRSSFLLRRLGQYVIAIGATAAAGAALLWMGVMPVVAWTLALGVYGIACVVSGLAGGELLRRPSSARAAAASDSARE